MSKPIMLITGVNGFIGSEAAMYFKDRYSIIGIDNFSRYSPVVHACQYIDELHRADICDIDKLALPKPLHILHLAAQVTVTRSISSPVADFYTNALGTFRLCLWAKSIGLDGAFIYANSNKVFGDNVSLGITVGDAMPLDPKTPYGVSKATGGLYVRELLPNNGYNFVQSCIYGEKQRGSVDQGWVAWLRHSIKNNIPITCFGDGTQVRDLLHVRDLLKAYEMAIERKDIGISDSILLPGTYVVGGGRDNSYNFREVVNNLGGKIDKFEQWRQDDQRYFVSSNDGLRKAGWLPNLVDWSTLRCS